MQHEPSFHTQMLAAFLAKKSSYVLHLSRTHLTYHVPHLLVHEACAFNIKMETSRAPAYLCRKVLK